ncbi:MAG: NAD-dependent epimerase/dehydratase family protein [Deltaproteobacteria bacterium]|nr:NAD-dependent epimerase/dehydratase family protein [Deltaproteobacteria bacterium]
MKILVTGVDGYIGTVLADYLTKRGHAVTGLDTGFYRDGWLYNDNALHRPPCINKDLRAITANDLRGFEAVVHLAELSNDPLGQHNPELTYAINHGGSVALASECMRTGISRFVYTSSCSVYGTGSGEFKSEESELNPQTAYARCKVLVENDLSALANDDFSPTFLRNATAYGASPRMRFDLVLNNLAGLAWTTKEIKMTSDGSPWRPLVHVRDIAHAIACALEAPRSVVHNQVFNVGSNTENYQVKEIAGVVAGAFPGCRLTFGNSDGDNRSYRVCFDKINSVLPGFKCRYDAATGAQQLHELFHKIEMPRDVFEFRAYTRLKQLQHLLRTRQIDDHFYWLETNRSESLTDDSSATGYDLARIARRAS